jgi:signal transduction histidine kinase
MSHTNRREDRQRKPALVIIGDRAGTLEQDFAETFTVVNMFSLQSAEPWLKKHKAALVLVVVGDPDADDPLALLEALRAEYPTLTLMAVLPDADPELEVLALQAGADDVLFQPINVDVALARIDARLDMRHVVEARDHTVNNLRQTQTLYTQLLRIATHDLKQPITNIWMVEGLLRQRLMIVDEPTELVDGLRSALDDMQQIIDDFLTVFASKQRLELEMQPLSAEQVIYHTFLQYSMHAVRKQIVLRIDGDGWFTGDEARFSQVLGNLVSNAIKYSPLGSRVNVYTEQDGGCLRFCVADEGPGIPAEERERLFTEFGKMSPRPTASESSTGLGLWIVKSLSEAMGGTVGAEFPESGGSIFWVQLPACEAPASARVDADAVRLVAY